MGPSGNERGEESTAKRDNYCQILQREGEEEEAKTQRRERGGQEEK